MGAHAENGGVVLALAASRVGHLRDSLNSTHVNRIRALLKPFAPDVGQRNDATREQWLEEALKQVPPGTRILDAGAGTQRYRKFCQHLRYVSQDIAEYDGQGDATGLQTGNFDFGKLDIVSDIGAIPEPDGSFGAIMCIEVFEHLPDPLVAVREFGRLLAPGGTLIITSPFASLTHFAPYHFCSGFNRYWYEAHLPAAGFTALQIVPNGNYFEFIAQELYRLPSVAKRYAGRRTGPITSLSMYLLLRALSRYSRADTHSSELLYFGSHVLARKAE
ncbi:MAG: coq3 4 [Gemmatimonadetes bacterium]|nr:coq3 4 [Gemmatimonadota bacterium]